MNKSIVVVVLFAVLAWPAAASAGRAYDVRGWVVVSRDAPVAQSAIVLRTPAGKIFGRGVSGVNGTFSVRTGKAIPLRFTVEAEGGVVGGLAFSGRMTSAVVNYTTDRPVVVSPATAIAAELTRRDARHRYPDAAARVKRYLAIPASLPLASVARWDTSYFDGREFLRQASLHGGIEAYVRARAAEILRDPQTQHEFHTRTFHEAAAVADITPTGVLQGAAASLVGGVAQSIIGDTLTSLGLSSLANTFGLGNKNEQLAQISAQIDAMNATLSQINTSLIGLSNSIAYTQQLAAQGNYEQIDIAASGISGLGGPGDEIQQELAIAGDDAGDIAEAISLLVPAAQANPAAWCAANLPSTSGTITYACTVISQELGDGGPTAAQLAGQTMLGWCGAHLASVGRAGGADAGTLVDATCAALQDAESFANGGNNDPAQMYKYLSGGIGGMAVVPSFDTYLLLTVAPQARGGFISAKTYSEPQDKVTAAWMTSMSLAGLYRSLETAVAQPGNTPQCYLTGTAITVAQCETKEFAGDATAIGYGAKADIPPATFIAIAPGDTAATEWTFAGELPNCLDVGIRLFVHHATTLWQSGGPQQSGNPLAPYSCALDPLSFSLTWNAFAAKVQSGTDTGFVVPQVADLQSLFAGMASPIAALTAIGMPNLNPNAAIVPPPFEAPADAYAPVTITNIDNPAAVNTATSLGVWSTCDTAVTWWTGYYGEQPAPGDEQTGINESITGTFCNYMSLADGSMHVSCTGASVGRCSFPWTSHWTCEYGFSFDDCGEEQRPSGAFDYGAPESVLLERALDATDVGQYWYPVA